MQLEDVYKDEEIKAKITKIGIIKTVAIALLGLLVFAICFILFVLLFISLFVSFLKSL